MSLEVLATLYVALNFIAAALTLGLSIYISWKQGYKSAFTFVLLLNLSTLNSLTTGFMMVSPNPEIAHFFENLRWLALAVTPPVMLIFILDFSGRKKWLAPKWLLLYLAIPLITQIIVWTNLSHGLVVKLGYDEFVSIGMFLLPGERVFGPWFLVYAAWGYLLIAVGLAILIYDARSTPKSDWQQFAWIFVGLCMPIVLSVIDTLKLLSPSWFKLLPFGFILMSTSFFFAIISGQFINITPVARGHLIKMLQDAVIIVDRSYRIVDLNPAAIRLIEKPKVAIIQQPASKILRRWEQLAETFKKHDEIPTAALTIHDNAGHYYDSHILPLYGWRQKYAGWVIVLHDVTKLKEAEARASQLAAVIEQAHETILITDLDGTITYANPFFAKTTGYTVEEALGKNPRILRSGKQDEYFYGNLWQTITQGKPWSGNFINRRKDGSLYHEAATIFPIKNEFGDTTHYATVKRDITKQVEADLALRHFSEKLAALSEINVQLTTAESFDEMCQMAVSLAHTHLGFDRVSLWFVDDKNPEFLHGSYGIDESGQVRDERNQRVTTQASNQAYHVLSSGQQRIFFQEDWPLRNDSAEIMGYGEQAVVLLWDSKKSIGYICIDNFLSGEHITPQQLEILKLFSQVLGTLSAQKRFEQALQTSEHQYRLLADNALDVIWTMDLNANFTYVSPSIKQLLGYTPEELLQAPVEKVLAPYAFSTFYKDFDEILATVKSGDEYPAVVRQLEQKRKDGQTIWTEINTTLLYNQDEEPFGFLGVTRDISERKKNEQALRTYARQQRLLNEITQAAIKQNDLETMLQTLADRLGELLEADCCFLALWDEENQRPIPQAAYGSARDTYREAPILEGRTYLTESVLEAGRVLVIDDVFSSPYLSPEIAALFPVKSGLALPLIADQRKLGAAFIAFENQHQFTQADRDLSQQAAHQIALAILKIKLLEEAQQRAREAETLRETSAAIVSTLRQDQAIERILKELNRVVPYDSAAVLLSKGEEMEIVGARGFTDRDQIIGIRFAVTEQTPNKVVFDTRKPYIIDDAPEIYEAFKSEPHQNTRGWMGIPLIIQDHLVGMLALDSHTPGRFNKKHEQLATAFADQVAIALENARLFEETQRLATIDALTNIYNRRYFMELSRIEFYRTSRYGKRLSIIMIDVDHFKQVNDTYGHLIGDQVLQTIASRCRENLRSIDIIGRYGGEEFIILLPETCIARYPKSNTSCEENHPAQTVAERLRQTVAETPIQTDIGKIQVTISLGLAEFSDEYTNIEAIIDNADQALLKAKALGRNRLIVHPAEDHHA